MRVKEPVAILGATGGVGQWLVHLLRDHPSFIPVHLTASERSAGRLYRESINWALPAPIPDNCADLLLHSCLDSIPCSIVFSSLPAAVSAPIERELAARGHTVFSNSSPYRLDPEIPLIIPEVNGEALLAYLQNSLKTDGMIIKNPNCCVAGLAVALKPLEQIWGIESVHVTTMQALSGAGLAKQTTLLIQDNVIPFINGEEEKIETELPKLLGGYENKRFTFSSCKVSAHCNRVNVSDGHLACVSIKLKQPSTVEALEKIWTNYPLPQNMAPLPYLPVRLFTEQSHPQPALHRMEGNGMTVCIGRLRKCGIMDFKCTLLTHNMVRGAAGLALQNAELYRQQLA